MPSAVRAMVSSKFMMGYVGGKALAFPMAEKPIDAHRPGHR
jgi:hypothetical protein